MTYMIYFSMISTYQHYVQGFLFVDSWICTSHLPFLSWVKRLSISLRLQCHTVMGQDSIPRFFVTIRHDRRNGCR